MWPVESQVPRITVLRPAELIFPPNKQANKHCLLFLLGWWNQEQGSETAEEQVKQILLEEFKKWVDGAGEITQQSKANTVLAGDPSSALSTYVR